MAKSFLSNEYSLPKNIKYHINSAYIFKFLKIKILKIFQKGPKWEMDTHFFQVHNPDRKTKKKVLLNRILYSGWGETFDDAKFQKIKKSLKKP